MTIDDDEERERFLEASKEWQNHKYMRPGMEKPQWCKAWVGAKKEGDGWCWDGTGSRIPDKYFSPAEIAEASDGRGFGAFEPIGNLGQSDDTTDKSRFLYSKKNVDWSVHGYVIERQAVWSSTYSLNAWVLGRHPNSSEIGDDKFYQNMADADGDVPLFSEGTGPVVMPRSLDVVPSNFRQGGQSGVGLSRLCIDRYGNMANSISRMDGSVESVKLMDLWKQKWHRGWREPKHVHGF